MAPSTPLETPLPLRALFSAMTVFLMTSEPRLATPPP
jgi:hypothetical protein